MKKYQRLIEFLLENAGVSIKYRVKKEILNVSVESNEMQKWSSRSCLVNQQLQ